MANAKKYDRFSILVIYALALLFLIITGCSSKKDATNAEESYPVKTDDNTPVVDNETQAAEPFDLPLPDVGQTIDVNHRTDASQTVKEINEPCEVRISTDTLLNEFNGTSSSERKIELLGSLFDMAFAQDPCVIGIVRTAVAEEDANVALAGIELLQGYESPEVLPAIADAMAHPNEDVRQTALNLLLDINDPQAGDLLVTALSDESEDIRDAALDITEYKDEQIRFRVLETGISSPYGDTKEKSVFMLEYMGGRHAVDILIEALRDKDAELREKAASAINTLLDKEFESYKEAKTWWEKNRNRYDEELSLIEDDQETEDN